MYIFKVQWFFSQVRSDCYVFAVLAALPWVGREMYEKKEGEFQKLLVTIENYIRSVTPNWIAHFTFCLLVLHGNIDQTLVNSLHSLLICEIGGLDCRIIPTEYISCVIEYTCNTYLVMH